MNMISKLGLVLACSALASPVVAATDYSGTYHSDAAKSSWSNGQFPKNFSLTIKVQFKDNKIVYTSANEHSPAADLNYTAPLDGTVIPMQGNARFNQISVKKIAPNELEILEMKDGDVLVASYWAFDRDGKGFVRRGVGKDASGKSHEYEEFYTKQ
jgi:hypothetical protein